MAVVRSLLALRFCKEETALHTLIHHRHPTPLCGGHVPTAERTLDPARMLDGELDRRPGIREQATGTAEREEAKAMIHCHAPGSTRRLTIGADKGYDTSHLPSSTTSGRNTMPLRIPRRAVISLPL